MTKENQLGLKRISWALAVIAASAVLSSCYNASRSQEYFSKESAQNPILEVIYTTPLYGVYFDKVLRRCVVHSSYVWGESGGGGGGAGIGVSVFACDPAQIRARLDAFLQNGTVPSRPSPRPSPALFETDPAPTPALQKPVVADPAPPSASTPGPNP